MNGVINQVISNIAPHSPLAPSKHLILIGCLGFLENNLIWAYFFTWKLTSEKKLKVSKPFFHIFKGKDINILNQRNFLSLKIRKNALKKESGPKDDKTV